MIARARHLNKPYHGHDTELFSSAVTGYATTLRLQAVYDACSDLYGANSLWTIPERVSQSLPELLLLETTDDLTSAQQLRQIWDNNGELESFLRTIKKNFPSSQDIYSHENIAFAYACGVNPETIGYPPDQHHLTNAIQLGKRILEGQIDFMLPESMQLKIKQHLLLDLPSCEKLLSWIRKNKRKIDAHKRTHGIVDIYMLKGSLDSLRFPKRETTNATTVQEVLAKGHNMTYFEMPRLLTDISEIDPNFDAQSLTYIPLLDTSLDWTQIRRRRADLLLTSDEMQRVKALMKENRLYTQKPNSTEKFLEAMNSVYIARDQSESSHPTD